MKAAIIYQPGSAPVYTDIPAPLIKNDDEVLINLKAAAVKNLDKSTASGQHYSTRADTGHAKIIGGDGVGILEDGTKVYAIGNGMLAEKAVIQKDRMVVLPSGIDDLIAAALPNAVIGSAMGLRFKAGIQPGDTVFINGATGFTGKMAVQVAKYYGAKRIIASGRNRESLQSLLSLGVDEIVSVNQDDETFINQVKHIHNATPIDIVIDYLWGHTAELLLAALKGHGSFTHKTRFVSIGAVTGDTVRLSAELLRSVNLQLSGSGLGSWTKSEVQILFKEILPEMFRLAAAGKLVVDTVRMKLEDIEQVWRMDIPGAKRLVVVI